MSYNTIGYNDVAYNQSTTIARRLTATATLSIKTQRTIFFDDSNTMTDINKITDTLEGETRILEFTAEDDDGTVNLSGATIKWSLADNETELLSTSDSEVSVDIVDNEAGRFDVTIDTFDVTAGGYRQRVSVTDSSGNVSKATGSYRVKDF